MDKETLCSNGVCHVYLDIVIKGLSVNYLKITRLDNKKDHEILTSQIVFDNINNQKMTQDIVVSVLGGQ